MHIGVSLPNCGPGGLSREAICRTAELAEELAFDSIWATEHTIVGAEGVDRYGVVFEPFTTLAWLAGQTARVELGTSITIVPLHNPFHLAKQVATLQLLAGRAFRLGVGAGWHEEEFAFMGVDFAGRGPRVDESIRLMRALWTGERSFDGEYWHFEDGTFAPLPALQPEIWIGGVNRRAVRRALELGDVWHPSSNVDRELVRQVKEEHPELRVVPRTPPELADEFIALGVDGLMVMFPDEASMRELASRLR